MSAMTTCLLDTPGSQLECNANVLSISHDQRPPRRIGLHNLGLLAIHGDVSAATGVWQRLADAGVAVVATSGGRHGPAWLGAGLSTTGLLRHRQHLAYADAAQRLHHARWVLEQKLLAMQLALASGQIGSAPAIHTMLQRAIEGLPGVATLDALNGVEGAASAQWFTQLCQRVDPRWGFTGRNRRPPRDPANALLSYGYALATADALTAVQQAGLDPALGFLHALYPGRHALALDAVECLRPVVDGWMLALLAEASAEDFNTSTAAGCQLAGAMRSRAIIAWHQCRSQHVAERLRHWAWQLCRQLHAHPPHPAGAEP